MNSEAKFITRYCYKKIFLMFKGITAILMNYTHKFVFNSPFQPIDILFA